MKRPFRLFESRRTPPTLPAIAGNGFLATTLSGLLMLLFGSAALMAAALSWQTAVSRGGVAGQARAAAERGFHAVIDRLNDPANGHLLVTNWDGSDWKPFPIPTWQPARSRATHWVPWPAARSSPTPRPLGGGRSGTPSPILFPRSIPRVPPNPCRPFVVLRLAICRAARHASLFEVRCLRAGRCWRDMSFSATQP